VKTTLSCLVVEVTHQNIEVLNVYRTVTTLRITGHSLGNGLLLCAEQEVFVVTEPKS